MPDLPILRIGYPYRRSPHVTVEPAVEPECEPECEHRWLRSASDECFFWRCLRCGKQLLVPDIAVAHAGVPPVISPPAGTTRRSGTQYLGDVTETLPRWAVPPKPAPRADLKDTNPKDTLSITKLDFGLVPSSAVALMALGFTEGALKYGRYNWRLSGVRASVYLAAACRHLFKWWNGEACDPKTKVPHLASAMCCLAIICDAELCEKLNDDRPPANKGFSKFVDDLEHDVKHLMSLFTEHKPKQYTIEDLEP